MFFIGVWGVAAYTFKASAKSLAFVMAGSSIASIIGSIIAGVLVDRIGPRRVLLYAELLTIPVCIALVFAQSWVVFVGLAWLLGLVGTPTFTAGAASRRSWSRAPRSSSESTRRSRARARRASCSGRRSVR